MPADSSPITFRVSPEDRDLLTAVAQYSGETLSSFVRMSALATARHVLADIGPEAVAEGVRSREDKRHDEARRRIDDGREYLRSQANRSPDEG